MLVSVCKQLPRFVKGFTSFRRRSQVHWPLVTGRFSLTKAWFNVPKILRLVNNSRICSEKGIVKLWEINFLAANFNKEVIVILERITLNPSNWYSLLDDAVHSGCNIVWEVFGDPLISPEVVMSGRHGCAQNFWNPLVYHFIGNRTFVASWSPVVNWVKMDQINSEVQPLFVFRQNQCWLCLYDGVCTTVCIVSYDSWAREGPHCSS